MSRFFIEVLYKGTHYAGFQIQRNANSIQAEVEKALSVFFRTEFALTGSSRTDAGVHALSNYFHFDTEVLSSWAEEKILRAVYNLNAILPPDIVIKRIFAVAQDAHCRFDAHSREYKYYICKIKDPFFADRAFYYPYKLDVGLLQMVASTILPETDFTSFSKRNTQVATKNCVIMKSTWSMEGGLLVYNVQANRFLRGMVRGLVGTMLRAGTGKINVDDFSAIILAKDCSRVDFSVPAQGLFLVNVDFKFAI